MYKSSSFGLSLLKFLLITFLIVGTYSYLGNVAVRYETNIAINPVSIEKETIYTDTIKERIIWERDYDVSIENTIINELQILPESILSNWLSIDSNVITVPAVRGYLNNTDIENDNPNLDSFIVAYNRLTLQEGKPVISKIYILGSEYYIKDSLLHEIGHFFYDDYLEKDYILPHFDEEKELFIANEMNGNTYFYNPKEYFAQMFAYVMHNGTNSDYPDTLVIKKLIDEYEAKYHKY